MRSELRTAQSAFRNDLHEGKTLLLVAFMRVNFLFSPVLHTVPKRNTRDVVAAHSEARRRLQALLEIGQDA